MKKGGANSLGGCEAAERQERGPRGKGRIGKAAEVPGIREGPDSIFPPPQPARAAAETAGGGASAAESANQRRERRSLCARSRRRRSLDLVFPERGELEPERRGRRGAECSPLSISFRIHPARGCRCVGGKPEGFFLLGRKLLPIGIIYICQGTAQKRVCLTRIRDLGADPCR